MKNNHMKYPGDEPGHPVTGTYPGNLAISKERCDKPMNKYSILVVEDEALIAANLVQLLTSLGYTVYEPVASGKDAIREVMIKKPDLVLMDIELLGPMNGIETAEKIRALVDIPIVYLTVLTDDLRLTQARLTEPYGYILKPAHHRELNATIKMALYKHNLDRKLKESEEKFRSITERISDLIIILDMDECPTYMSPSVTPILGYPPELYIGKRAGPEIVHAEDVPKIEKAMERLKKGTAEERVEFRMKKSDGSYAVFDGKGIPVITGGVQTGVQVVARDITDRQLADKALRESEDKYRSIVENTNDAIYIHDFKGTIIDVNDNACRMVGYARDELIGNNLSMIDKEWHLPENKNLEQLLRDNRGVFTRENICKNGSILPVEVSVRLISRKEHGLVFAFVRDITDRNRAEAALKEANKKLTLLSGITRHDINNQLTLLRGYLNRIAKQSTDSSVRDYLQKSVSAAEQIFTMIQFTKEYEKIGVHAPVWRDFHTLIEAAAKDTLPGQVTMNNNIPFGVEVFVDPLIVKVWFNLMDNAVRYGNKATNIRFSLQESEKDCIILCEDDGIGIPCGEKEKIFECGYGQNTGLGLFLAREILGITGITIRETGEPGKGARFVMTVPENTWRLSGQGYSVSPKPG